MIALQQQLQQQMQQQFQMAMNGGNGREREQVAHNNEDGEPESKIDAIQKQIDALRSVLMKEKEKQKKRNAVTSQSVEKEKEKKKEDTSYSSENAVDGASVDMGLETKTDATNTDLLQKTPGKETTKRLSSSARLDSPRDIARQRMAEAALRRSNSVDSEQAD